MTVLNLHDVPVKYGSAVAHTVENRVLEQRDGGPAFQGTQVPSEHWWDFFSQKPKRDFLFNFETPTRCLYPPSGTYILLGIAVGPQCCNKRVRKEGLECF